MPSDTHDMYHRVLNLLLKADNRGHFGGLNNYSKGSSWQRHFELHPQARKQLYLRIRVAAKIVDNLCELKSPNNINSFVRKHKKKFVDAR